MVIIRCTKRLLLRLPSWEWGPCPKSTTVLGDWCGNQILVGSRRMILVISERSRLPALLPVQDVPRLHTAIPSAVSEVLRCISVPGPRIEREVEAMSELLFTPTNSRSLLGSLNDFTFQIRSWFEMRQDYSLLEMALKLSETPVSPLAYQHPSDITRRLFGCQ